jgi:hypothetical protein
VGISLDGFSFYVQNVLHVPNSTLLSSSKLAFPEWSENNLLFFDSS